MLPVFCTVGWAIPYCVTPRYTVVGTDAARFVNGWCAKLCGPTLPYTTVAADAARIMHGWLDDPLLRYPSLHHCWGRCCPFYKQLVRKPLVSYPPLHYSRGTCCSFFVRLAERSSAALPPPTPLLGQMLPV